MSLPREAGSTLGDIERRLTGLPMRSSAQRVTYERHRRTIFGERHESFSYESRIAYQELAGLILAGARGIVHEALLERSWWTEDAILLARHISRELSEDERRLDELVAHNQADWLWARAQRDRRLQGLPR
jgi:hypothetical protein